MEKSKVYFTDFHTIAFGDSLPAKLKKLIKKAGIADLDMDGKFIFVPFFILTVYVCANVAISFISIFGFAAYHPFVLTAILLNIQILIFSPAILVNRCRYAKRDSDTKR